MGARGSRRGSIGWRDLRHPVSKQYRTIFGDHETHELTGPGGEPIQATSVSPDISGLVQADPVAARLLADLAERMAAWKAGEPLQPMPQGLMDNLESAGEQFVEQQLQIEDAG